MKNFILISQNGCDRIAEKRKEVDHFKRKLCDCWVSQIPSCLAMQKKYFCFIFREGKQSSKQGIFKQSISYKSPDGQGQKKRENLPRCLSHWGIQTPIVILTRSQSVTRFFFFVKKRDARM